jgi:Tfp pilus assembly protein PilX
MTHRHTDQYRNVVNHEQGNILVTSLLMLIVINLLGIGLVYSSVRESTTATYKTIESTTFHVSESCTQEAMGWLGDFSAPPEDGVDLPYQVTADNLDSFLTGTEGDAALNKLNGYGYDCEVTYMTVKSVAGSSGGATEGTGEDVSVSGGYGASGDTSPKYYYQIEAVSSGPNDSTKRMYTIVSAQY